MVQSAVRYARVLAIDDSPDFLSSLAFFFETARGCELVATARSGDEGLPLVEELQPDLVLMDLQMPGINGLQATVELRRRFPEIPVVIVTAHQISCLRQICYDNGAFDLVTKSRLDDELPGVLARILRSRES
jgi:CheY-like chemotaxis protein